MTNNTAARPGTANSAGGTGRLAQFKLVLLGESAVGKSSLVLRFVKGQFHEFQVRFNSFFDKRYRINLIEIKLTNLTYFL